MACTTEEVVLNVQFIMGFPDEAILPPSVITLVMNKYLPYYTLEDNCCELIYFTAIACMEFLIKKLGGSGEGLGGASFEEKEGGVTVKQSFGKVGVLDFWKDELKRFRNNPEALLPCMREVLAARDANGYIIFGGVSAKEVDRVNNLPDRFNAEDEFFSDLDYQLGMPKRNLRG